MEAINDTASTTASTATSSMVVEETTASTTTTKKPKQVFDYTKGIDAQRGLLMILNPFYAVSWLFIYKI